MSDLKVFDRGALAGALAMLGAIAVHWFITPMRHPDAGFLEHAAAGAQLAIGLGGAALLRWRQGRRAAAGQPHEDSTRR